MGSQRQLVKNVSRATAGRLHTCHSNKKHILKKGDAIFVVKEDRNSTHYCVVCGLTFIATARKTLDEIEAQFRSGPSEA